METYEEIVAIKDEPVVLADQNGIITAINPCFAETFKWVADDLRGQLLTAIMPASFRDSHSMGFSRFLTTLTRTLPEHALDLNVMCGDGTVLKSRHTIVAGQTENGSWRFAGKIVPLPGE